MIVQRFVTDLLFSNMYVLTEREYAIVIDPWVRCEICNGLIIDKLLITHEHYDHISGVNIYKEKYGTKLLCSVKCAENIRSSKKNSARYFEAFSQLQTYNVQDITVPIDSNYTCNADYVFDDEFYFLWQGNEFYLFSLPGHSSGSIGILVNNKHLFSGDSIFLDRDTELRLPGGSKKQWSEVSVPKLNKLSDDIIVYPGHGGKFTLKERRVHGGF